MTTVGAALKRLAEFWETDVPAHGPVLLAKAREHSRSKAGGAAVGVLITVANLDATVIATLCLTVDEIAPTLHEHFGYAKRSREAVVFETLVAQASLADGHLAVCMLSPRLSARFPAHMAILVPDAALATAKDVEAHLDIELDGAASALVLRVASGKPTMRVCQNASCSMLDVLRPDIDQAALMVQTRECDRCKLVCCAACAAQHRIEHKE